MTKFGDHTLENAPERAALLSGPSDRCGQTGARPPATDWKGDVYVGRGMIHSAAAAIFYFAAMYCESLKLGTRQ